MRVAILLAAGASRRMGRPKLDLLVMGKRMSRLVAETFLSAPFDRVRVVTAPGSPLDLPPDGRLELLENPETRKGIASSIRRGLEGLPPETRVAALALADLPLVRGETLGRLCLEWETSDRPILYPEYRGGQGHPVFWAASFFDELRSLEGDRGAKGVLERYHHLDLALGVPVDDPGVCLDIDTPDDYARVAGSSPEDSAMREP
jgi:molybdenum cofactor cytidylyltransferase